MFVITKEIKHFFQHIYLELANDYFYKYMLHEFLKYISMYYNSSDI